MILTQIEGESPEAFLARYEQVASKLGYPPTQDSGWNVPTTLEDRSAFDEVESRQDDNCGRDEGGKFGEKNTCQEDGEGGGDAPSAGLKIPPPLSPPPEGFQRPPAGERSTALSTAKIISGDEKLDLSKKRGSVPELDMAVALTNRAIAANGGHPVLVDEPLSREDADALSDALAEDTQAAYKVMGQHEGWYSKDVGDAKEIARSMPGNERIGDGVDGFVFDLGLGLLSAQNSVPDNARYADGFYRHWVDTGSLVVPKEYATALGRGANLKQFEFVQRLADEHGWDDVMKYFSGVDTVGNIAKGEIGQTILAPGLSKKQRQSIFGVSGEHVDRVLPRLSIFGPKVGPFTHAIHSQDFNYMVSDRWAMRQFGTLTGTLVHQTDPSKTRLHCQTLIENLSGVRTGSPLMFGLKKGEVTSSLRASRDAGFISDDSPAMSFIRSTVAAYAKSKNPSGGGYGDKTPLNLAANNAFKNKVTMELAPGTGQVSKNVHEVFDRARQKVGARDILEVQALGWGYTQKLWQAAGYRLKRSPESNTFSKAMQELKDGTTEKPRISSLAGEVERQRREAQQEKKGKKSKRSLEYRFEQDESPDDDSNDLNSIGRELQMVFDEQFSDEKAFEEYCDYVSGLIADFKKGGSSESRSCDKADGGRFGPGNDCAASDGSSTEDAPRPKVDASWKTDSTATHWTDSDLKQSPPAKSLSKVKSVAMVDPELVADSLKEVGVSLDQAAKVLAPVSNPEAAIQVVHGNLAEAAEFLADPEADRVPMPTVTFSSSVPVSGIQNAVQTAASLTRTDDNSLVMSYSMFNVSSEAQQNAKFAVGREMMKGVIESISKADKLGVSEIMMSAAGSDADSQFKGYRIWPRLGFDGVIDRKAVTPTWSIGRGFFEPYGSKIPDSILSPRAKAEKASGKLTVQALYETPDGQSWWEQNGREMFMSLSPGSDTPGWKKFNTMRDKFGKRSLELFDAFGDSAECRSLLDEIWTEFRFDPNQPRENDGKFAPKGGGGSSGGPTILRGDATQDWGKSRETEIWTPDRPLFGGAENIPSIRIENPSDVRGIAEDELKMPISAIVSAAGPVIDSAKRAGITLPRMEIRRDMFGGLNVSWTAKGVATGRGFAEDEKQYVTVGQSVSAVEANRTIQRTRSGIVMSMNGFFLHPDFQGMGLAFESHVRSLSVPSERVKMTAERNDSPDPMVRMTGYSAWIKIGYNAPMSKVSLRIPVPEKFRPAKTLLDLYRIPGGREWWTEVGHSIELEFDRRPRSDSMETMLKLQEAFRAKHSRRSVDMAVDQNRVGCDCDFDKLIDEVWDDFAKSGPSGKTGNSPTQEDWDRWDRENAELKAKDGSKEIGN